MNYAPAYDPYDRTAEFDSKDVSENRRKKIVMAFLEELLVVLVILLNSVIPKSYTGITVEYTELGVPLSNLYESGIAARCPWDIIVYDDKLYIGGGDFDANKGPVDIWAYDMKEDAWENTGTVPDHQVNRFVVINDDLIVPGMDPQEDWEWGNYYILRDGTWEEKRNIPGGVHNFDMVENDGLIFAGLGVEEGKYTIVCSKDNGETFSSVELIKDGKSFDMSKFNIARTYDMFVYGGEVYATLVFVTEDSTIYDVYKYENGAFRYHGDLLHNTGIKYYSYNKIGSKLEIDGNFYMTTGRLYSTSDMQSFELIKLSENTIVYDLYEANGRLYALCGEKMENGKYKTSVWIKKKGNSDEFCEMFNFIYDVPPLSFACLEDNFYIGMGDYISVNDKNGMILLVDLF